MGDKKRVTMKNKKKIVVEVDNDFDNNFEEAIKIGNESRVNNMTKSSILRKAMEQTIKKYLKPKK